MFETSPANLSLFELEPIVTFAERLITGLPDALASADFRAEVSRGLMESHLFSPISSGLSARPPP